MHWVDQSVGTWAASRAAKMVDQRVAPMAALLEQLKAAWMAGWTAAQTALKWAAHLVGSKAALMAETRVAWKELPRAETSVRLKAVRSVD